MASITMERWIDAPAAVVWNVITDHELYGVVAPNLERVDVVSGAGEGMIRRCVDTDGKTWTESCTRWAPGEGFAVTVDVAESEFHAPLFDRFEGSWDLESRGDGVVVRIHFEFDARYGPLGWLISAYLRYRAPPVIEAIFDGWEEEIEARMGADSTRPARRASHRAEVPGPGAPPSP